MFARSDQLRNSWEGLVVALLSLARLPKRFERLPKAYLSLKSARGNRIKYEYYRVKHWCNTDFLMIAAFPPNEAERLSALLRYDVLDTDPELAFDDITLLVVTCN